LFIITTTITIIIIIIITIIIIIMDLVDVNEYIEEYYESIRVKTVWTYMPMHDKTLEKCKLFAGNVVAYCNEIEITSKSYSGKYISSIRANIKHKKNDYDFEDLYDISFENGKYDNYSYAKLTLKHSKEETILITKGRIDKMLNSIHKNYFKHMNKKYYM
jgi:hypothetical protein